MSATELKTFTTRDFRLQSGGVLPEAGIAYRTVGTLSPDRDNAVLIPHGNTSGPQMIEPGGSTGEGSWSEIVGPGKAVDTNRFFAICPNMLGSSYGSTNGASIDPATGKPYGARFPDLTVSDIVGTQKLLIDSLGIKQLVAIVGPSYGGFQAFQWAVNYPDMMRGIAPVVTAPLVPRERSEGNVERLLGSLSKDPNWNGGDYYDRGGVKEAMTQIRMATLKSYGIETRLKQTMSDPAQIEAAVRDESARWAESFDANSLIILAKALRGFDVTKQFDRIKAKVLFVLSRTDKLFPPDIAPGVMQGLKAAGVDADYFLLDSELGHSASGLDAHLWAPRLKMFMEGL
ncbi:MAG: alpha/beta fold hydrolase [bacterium]|nr:alpha/beta fold hydrolase [bacterium]